MDSAVFRPVSDSAAASSSSPRDTVTVVIGSRLVYRKGIDLVAEAVPRICGRRFGKRRARVDFVVAGDGPKRILLEEMIEKYNLQSRVVMLGELQHSQVRDRLLAKGTS